MFCIDIQDQIASHIDNVHDMIVFRSLSRQHYEDTLTRPNFLYLILEYALKNNRVSIAKVLESFPEIAKMKSKRNGSTLLHRTYISIYDFQALLEAGADINAQDDDGNTPLHIAAMLSVPTLRWLILAGANTKLLNNNGQNILHVVDSTIGAAIIIEKNVCLFHQKDKKQQTPYSQNRFVKFASGLV